MPNFEIEPGKGARSLPSLRDLQQFTYLDIDDTDPDAINSTNEVMGFSFEITMPDTNRFLSPDEIAKFEQELAHIVGKSEDVVIDLTDEALSAPEEKPSLELPFVMASVSPGEANNSSERHTTYGALRRSDRIPFTAAPDNTARRDSLDLDKSLFGPRPTSRLKMPDPESLQKLFEDTDELPEEATIPENFTLDYSTAEETVDGIKIPAALSPGITRTIQRHTPRHKHRRSLRRSHVHQAPNPKPEKKRFRDRIGVKVGAIALVIAAPLAALGVMKGGPTDAAPETTTPSVSTTITHETLPATTLTTAPKPTKAIMPVMTTQQEAAFENMSQWVAEHPDHSASDFEATVAYAWHISQLNT